jgi:hypothetical protein
MPMGVVSTNEFEKQKKDLDIVEIPFTNDNNDDSETNDNPIVVEIPKGRGKGNVEVPESLRNLIGIESVDGSRASAIQLAKQFGLSESSVSAYTQGASSTASYDRRPGASIIRKAKERISKKARGRLVLALSKLTSEKLDMASARELSGVAKDMSTIVKNMETSEETQAADKAANGPTFVFYAPQLKKPDEYSTVVAKE